MWVSWPDVGVVDPGSNPVDVESGGSGQAHDVGSLPVRLKCVALVFPDVHPIARPVSMGARGWPSLVESPQLRPHLGKMSSSSFLVTVCAISRLVGNASVHPENESTNTSKYLYPLFSRFYLSEVFRPTQ